MEPLRIEFSVACSPARAFEVWTAETSHWWPRGHSVSADPDLSPGRRERNERGWAGVLEHYRRAAIQS